MHVSALEYNIHTSNEFQILHKGLVNHSECVFQEDSLAPQFEPTPIRMLSWTAHTMFTTEGENQPWFQDFGSSPMDICYSPEFNYISPEYQCTLTNDKAKLNVSDVVLFRGRRLSYSALPQHRQWNQTWVFFEFEPPYKVWQKSNLSLYNSVFNLTYTHTLNADMAYTYYLSKRCARDNARFDATKHVDFTVNKTRKVQVAWIVSVCETQSHREVYVKELKKYIAVDIYGQCGKLRCGSNNLSTWSSDNCDENLFHDKNSYKFYLAFENSLCEDYISEKLWKVMKLNVVPIVMGAVDYSTILPRDTYIDVRNYPSPRKLAQHLQRLAKNKKAYNGYLRRKDALTCFGSVPYMPKQCFLCKRLHEIKAMGRPQWVVHDLATMYSHRHCLTQEQFFSQIKNNSYSSWI